MLFYRRKNEKICQRTWIFVIFKKSLQQLQGKLLDTSTKTGLDASKIASRKVVHKTPETTAELIGNKITGVVVKPKPVFESSLRNVGEIVTSLQKR